MNQIEINKIVKTVNGEITENYYEIYRPEVLSTGQIIKIDHVSYQPSQMKELKEKIMKLDI